MMPNRLFKDGSTDGVRRLSARQLERHRIYVDPDGRFRWAQDGTPLHTYTGDDYLRREGKAIFAMDERGNLYASKSFDVGVFHHSTLGNGGPVAAAGELAVTDGRLTHITDRSGHYRPPRSLTRQFVDQLKNKGVDASDLKGAFEGASD